MPEMGKACYARRAIMAIKLAAFVEIAKSILRHQIGKRGVGWT
jgi:hypothetical protein